MHTSKRSQRWADKHKILYQADDSIRDLTVTGVQTCALPIFNDTDLVITRDGKNNFIPSKSSDGTKNTQAVLAWIRTADLSDGAAATQAFSEDRKSVV